MTKISDIFVRELWTAEVIKESAELVNFTSGAHIVQNALISQKVNAQDSGVIIKIPYVAESLYVEPSVMDDSDDEIVSDKISKVEDTAYIGFYAKSFGEKDIIQAIGSGIDPLDAALSLLSRYWAKDLQKRMIATLAGIYASEKIKLAGNTLVLDKTGTAFSYDLVIDALGLLGDAAEGFSTVLAHSAIVRRMLKEDKITTIKDSELGIDIKIYNDMLLISNDGISFEGLAAGNYVTAFLKPAAFAFEYSTAIKNPMAVVKNEKSGNGAGETEVISRSGFLLHPQGFSLTSATIDAGITSPTVAQLQTATFYKRTVDVKQSKIVFLVAKA